MALLFHKETVQFEKRTQENKQKPQKCPFFVLLSRRVVKRKGAKVKVESTKLFTKDSKGSFNPAVESIIGAKSESIFAQNRALQG